MTYLLLLLLFVVVCSIILQARISNVLRESLALGEKAMKEQQELIEAYKRSDEAHKRWIASLQEQVRTQQQMIDLHTKFVQKLHASVSNTKS